MDGVMKKNNQMRRVGRSGVLALAAVAAFGLSACNKNVNQAGAQQPPAPMVSVLTVEPTSVTLDSQLTGRLQPIREALVIAQATGVVKKRLFTEGSEVKAGQSLFQIDNAPYLANLETARASLATAQANLAKASADVTRYRPLVQANAISKQEFDAAIAQERLARAQIQSANAAIRSAQINVGYASVLAPISGRIGKALVTEGALVGQRVEDLVRRDGAETLARRRDGVTFQLRVPSAKSISSGACCTVRRISLCGSLWLFSWRYCWRMVSIWARLTRWPRRSSSRRPSSR